jgi:alanine-glyoxylate transaminase/serine-glyoxylate transaminase/serine-pyruvate transaminase
MPLANGRPYLAIPGPSVMPDRVLQAMHRPAPNIYTGELVDMTETLWPDLRALAGTRGHVALYIANGHGAWEAANTNVFSRGDTALVLSTGRFGIGWAESVAALGVRAEIVDFGTQAMDMTRAAQALRDHRDAKAVLVTQVDTSSSARTDIAALRAAMDAAGHKGLLMVDCIASLGCDEFRMDDWGVDVMVSASQKGLMVPPGLAFVWASDKARAVGQGAGLRTPYWDWTARFDARFFYQYFGGTAPTHHLYGLRAALDMIAEEGLPQIWDRHRRLARGLWAAVDHWGQNGDLRLNIADPDARGHAVTTIRTTGGDGTRLRRWCEQEGGVTLGIGLGMNTPEDPASDNAFRVGHMGHVNAHMVLGVLGVIEAGLGALGIAHRPGGVTAAVQAMGA